MLKNIIDYKVWDKKLKIFIPSDNGYIENITLEKRTLNPKEIVFYEQIILQDNNIKLKRFTSNDFELFEPVKIANLSKKSIYVDSSIVSFDLDISDKSSDRSIIKLEGIFTWNDEDGRYDIDMPVKYHPYVSLYYNPETMSNFNVIGTIQENVFFMKDLYNVNEFELKENEVPFVQIYVKENEVEIDYQSYKDIFNPDTYCQLTHQFINNIEDIEIFKSELENRGWKVHHIEA